MAVGLGWRRRVEFEVLGDGIAPGPHIPYLGAWRAGDDIADGAATRANTGAAFTAFGESSTRANAAVALHHAPAVFARVTAKQQATLRCFLLDDRTTARASLPAALVARTAEHGAAIECAILVGGPASADESRALRVLAGVGEAPPLSAESVRAALDGVRAAGLANGGGTLGLVLGGGLGRPPFRLETGDVAWLAEWRMGLDVRVHRGQTGSMRDRTSGAAH
ncbi:MAG: hypothetical protein IT302_00185 [Dehalococcoidia bacterium]|nr:hypothetical protein [Dehalococcoidia bacterium]